MPAVGCGLAMEFVGSELKPKQANYVGGELKPKQVNYLPGDESNGGSVTVHIPESAVGDVLPDGALRICTLNVGGRNTNSFEFQMAGDGSSLAQQWKRKHSLAMRVMGERGPSGFTGLREAVQFLEAELLGVTERDPLIAALLEMPSWSAMLEEVGVREPKLFNAVNMASLAAGRPSPLERPGNVDVDAALFAQWHAWLRRVLPLERSTWQERISRKSLPPLTSCLCALLIFDAMCADAVQAMYTGTARGKAEDKAADEAHDTPLALRPFGDAMRDHLLLHAQLPFTSDAGRFRALAAALEEAGWPEVVCLQEAAELAKRPATAPAALFETYDVFSAPRETVLLLKRGMLRGTLHPDSQWRVPLASDGGQLAWDMKVDWQANLDKSLVVATTWDEMPVALVATHLKPSAASQAYIVALRRTLENAFAVVVIGMDANTPAGQQGAFGRQLGDNWLMHSAKPGTRLSVRKQRTRLQTQLGKVKLDSSMKDWIVTYRRDWWRVSLGAVQYTPTISRDSEVLLPTTEWPFDHAMVSTHLVSHGSRALEAATASTAAAAWKLSLPKLAVGSLLQRQRVHPRAQSADAETGTESAMSTERSDEEASSFSQRVSTRSRDEPLDAIGAMARDVCRDPLHAIYSVSNLLQIALITLAMGALEIDDRRLLLAFCAAMILVIAVGLFVLNFEDTPMLAICSSAGFSLASALLLLLIRHFALKIEGLDRCAWKFDEVRKSLLSL